MADREIALSSVTWIGMESDMECSSLLNVKIGLFMWGDIPVFGGSGSFTSGTESIFSLLDTGI